MRDIHPANMSGIAYTFAAVPVRIALENSNWDEAAHQSLHASDIEWENYPWQTAILHFGRALGAAHTSDFTKAKSELKVLMSLRDVLTDRGEAYMADQVMIQVKSADAWIKFLDDDQAGGLMLMAEAAEMESKTSKHPVTPCEVLPARELLGDMLLSMNMPGKALIEYERNLQEHPNRFNGLYGAALALQLSGSEAKAEKYYKLVVEMGRGVVSDRKELILAKAYLAAI